MAEVIDLKEQKEPALTIDSFYEKTIKLNEVFQNNMAELHRTFSVKQAKLFARLSDSDKQEVIRRERQKIQDQMKQIAVPDKTLVGLNGKKIGGNA